MSTAVPRAARGFVPRSAGGLWTILLAGLLLANALLGAVCAVRHLDGSECGPADPFPLAQGLDPGEDGVSVASHIPSQGAHPARDLPKVRPAVPMVSGRGSRPPGGVSSPKIGSALATVRPVLEAIWEVETRRSQDRRHGDGGRAAGPLQQHRAHWDRGCRAMGVRWAWPGASPAGGHGAEGVERAFRVALANWMLDAPLLVEEARRTGLHPPLVGALARFYRLPSSPHRPDNNDYARRVVAAWKTR